MDAIIGGWTYYHARQYENAIAEVHRAHEMDRTFGNGYLILSLAYSEMGKHDTAVEMAGRPRH